MEVTKKELKQMYYDMVTIRYASLSYNDTVSVVLRPY